jgi:hypothetical protein
MTTTIKVTDQWKPRFFSIWLGQAFSLVGSALTQFVLLWWITDTTGSAQALAIAGMMALLPQALLGPLGGTLADRWNRRRLERFRRPDDCVCAKRIGEPELQAEANGEALVALLPKTL